MDVMKVIDCDVHNEFVSHMDLVPLMKEPEMRRHKSIRVEFLSNVG